MMMVPRRPLLLGALLAPAACRSPEPALYTILPVAGEVRRGGPRSVTVREVGLARYMDRQQIVRSSESYRLEVSGNDWWGEPLEAMLTRVLVENLSQRLPQSGIVASTGAITGPADVTVEVNVQRLGLTAPQVLTLTAQVAVNWREARRQGSPARPGRDATARTESFAVPVEGTEIRGFVQAASAGMGRLSDTVAGLLSA